MNGLTLSQTNTDDKNVRDCVNDSYDCSFDVHNPNVHDPRRISTDSMKGSRGGQDYLTSVFFGISPNSGSGFARRPPPLILSSCKKKQNDGGSLKSFRSPFPPVNFGTSTKMGSSAEKCKMNLVET